MTAPVTNCRPLSAPPCPLQTFVNVGHGGVAQTATRAAAAFRNMDADTANS